MQMYVYDLCEWAKEQQLRMRSGCRCVVPQSLFGKRVSVKRHAVKTQMMSELDEHQKTFVFVVADKKRLVTFYKLDFWCTHTHSVCKRMYAMEKTFKMLCITVQQTTNINTIFKSIVSFWRHTTELMRENKLVPCFYPLWCTACTMCGQNNGNTLIKTSHGNECLKWSQSIVVLFLAWLRGHE